MPSERDKAKRWRPRQFSLRTLLILMFGVACFFGGWAAHEWKRQREIEHDQKEFNLKHYYPPPVPPIQ